MMKNILTYDVTPPNFTIGSKTIVLFKSIFDSSGTCLNCLYPEMGMIKNFENQKRGLLF